MEPLVNGDYPSIMKRNAGSRIPTFTSRESEQIRGSWDFVGVIHYTVVNFTDNSDVLKNKMRDSAADTAALTVYGQDLLSRGQRIPSNSSLEDVSRVTYLEEYIGGVLHALRNGSNVRGYFAWSF